MLSIKSREIIKLQEEGKTFISFLENTTHKYAFLKNSGALKKRLRRKYQAIA